jgi:hypothetical protein
MRVVLVPLEWTSGCYGKRWRISFVIAHRELVSFICSFFGQIYSKDERHCWVIKINK